MSSIKNLEKLIRDLPPDLQQEVEDFVQLLKVKRLKSGKGKPSFSWGGALKDLQNQYTSVELQHKILEWRI